MVLVIPLVELRNGFCSFCIEGERGTEEFYVRLTKNPKELTKLLRRENAKSLHIVDYDSLRDPSSRKNKNAIMYIAQNLDIPVELHSVFQTAAEADNYLNNGIYRVVTGRLAFMDPTGFSALIKEYTPSRVAFGIFPDSGVINIKDPKVSITDMEACRYAASLGAKRVVYGESDWEQAPDMPDLSTAIRIYSETGMKVTLFEAVRSAPELWRVNDMGQYGIDSVVIGRALYENKFPCQKIWRLIEAKLEKE